MRIVVCVKHVPDLQSMRGYGPDARTVRTAQDGTLNEIDENAVEAALTLRAEGDEVIALGMGPQLAADAIGRALQMGVDRGVHLCDDALAGSDYLGTTRALAAAIAAIESDGPVDLVLTGITALDGLGSVVPAMLAAALQRPHLGVVGELTLQDGQLRARRDLDGVTEIVHADLPAVVAVTDMINSPRFPQFADIIAAKDKPVRTLSLADIGLSPDQVGQTGAAAMVESAEPSPPREEPEFITDDDGEAGDLLARYLIERELI